MKFPHNLMHYLIGAAAITLGVCSLTQAHHANRVTVVSQSGVVASEKISRFDWPTLGQDATISLGEDLKDIGIKKVTLYCAVSSCHQISLDIDDALQIANIESAFESNHVDSESDEGIFVGPPGDAASTVATAIAKATGLSPVIVPIDGITGVGVIIGKYKGAK